MASLNLAAENNLAMVLRMDEALKHWLQPGERLLWSARPNAWHYTRPTFMLYIAGVPWTVFTFYWLDAVTGGFQWPKKVVYPYPDWTPWVAIGAGLVLLVAGLWMLNAPFWIWRKSRRILHLVTDQRAAVLDLGHPEKAEILPLEGQVEFRITQPGGGTSDLELLCGGSSKGVLFRAVDHPSNAIALISAARNSG